MKKQTKTFYRFQQIGTVHKLYIYDEIRKQGDFDWESWSYEDSETSASHFRDLLDEIPDTDSIEILFNSCGGSVDQGTAIFNALKMKKCQKTGIVMGVCHSIAFTILQACDVRIMGQGTTAIIHDMWETFTGNSTDFRTEADNLDVAMDSCIALFMQRSKISEEELRDLMHKETTLSPQLALEYGLIDKIGVDEEDDGKTTNPPEPDVTEPPEDNPEETEIMNLKNEISDLKRQLSNRTTKQEELSRFFQLTHEKRENKENKEQTVEGSQWDAFFNAKNGGNKKCC